MMMGAKAPLLLALVAWLRGAFGACPAKAKAFPSHLKGEVSMKHAELFTIHYYENYKVIKRNPSLGKYKTSHPETSLRDTVIPDIVLYQCGTTAPTSSSTGVGKNARFTSVPLESASIAWTGVLHSFEMLSVTEAIQLIDMSYISSPCMQLLETCTPGLHIANSNATWAKNAKMTQAVFTDAFATGWSNSTRDVEFDSSLDPGILGRAEWIRFIAAFFNEEDQALEIYNKIVADYNALKNKATQLANARTSGPLQVAWVTKSDWKQQPDGSWCSTCGGPYYRISNAHFKRDLVADAGGRLLPMPQNAPENCTFDKQTDGTTLFECKAAALTSFHKVLHDADVIVDEVYASGHDPFAADFFANFQLSSTSDVKALKQDPPRVYRIDRTVSDKHESGNVGNSWYESMPGQPQRLLAGMMEAIWGDEFESPCGMTYLRYRYGSSNKQNAQGHTDCPLHSEGKATDCKAIHDFEHTIHQCGPKTQEEASSALQSAVMPALALLALALHA